MHYVYILQFEQSGTFYTGYTSDLRKRLVKHQSGESTYTKSKGAHSLIYYEACHNKSDALAREKYLKSGVGKRYIKNRLRRFLALTG